MGKIESVVVWLGGVLADTVPESTSRALYAQGIHQLDLASRVRLRDLARELALGRIDVFSFCCQAAAQAGREMSAEELDARIRERLAVREEVLELIAMLPSTLQRWLISDYPAEWHRALASRSTLSSDFPESRTIATNSLRLSRLAPDIYYAIALRAGLPLNQCLMIDGESARAVEATRHGLPAVIFVDARRLKREFVLREILPRHSNSIHDERLHLFGRNENP